MGNNTYHAKNFGYDFLIPHLMYYYALVNGTTWARPPYCHGSHTYYRTLRGDGIIANIQSWIPCNDFRSFSGLSHFGLVHNATVINYIIRCIENPNTEGHKVSLNELLYPSDPAAIQITVCSTPKGSIKTASDINQHSSGGMKEVWAPNLVVLHN